MDPDFWRARWSEGRIGFHEGRPNALLVAHHAQLGAKRRVLVPLCGKTVDLAWLAVQGHEVVGVELVEAAVRAFFEEHGLIPEISEAGGLRSFTAGPITIFAGDFFATTRELLGPVDALYDRAANVALPRELRERYVEHVRALLPAGAAGLLITFEYPQDQLPGPPFSLTAEEVREAYAGLQVEQLADRPCQVGRPVAVAAREKCFSIQF